MSVIVTHKIIVFVTNAVAHDSKITEKNYVHFIALDPGDLRKAGGWGGKPRAAVAANRVSKNHNFALIGNLKLFRDRDSILPNFFSRRRIILILIFSGIFI